MKMKVKILVIALMAIFCIAPTSVPKAEAAGTLKTMYVHPSIWSVHGIYTKTSTGKIVYAKNASGFGKMEYCYGQVRSNISGSCAAYSSSIKLYKNNKNTTMNLTNTIDKNKSVSLRVVGLGSSQTSDDKQQITFIY